MGYRCLGTWHWSVRSCNGFMSYCCVTIYDKCIDLKEPLLIIVQFLYIRIRSPGMVRGVLCLGCHKTGTKWLARLWCHLKAWRGKPTWGRSFPGAFWGSMALQTPWFQISVLEHVFVALRFDSCRKLIQHPWSHISGPLFPH